MGVAGDEEHSRVTCREREQEIILQSRQPDGLVVQA
jgi:hypothetical protein